MSITHSDEERQAQVEFRRSPSEFLYGLLTTEVRPALRFRVWRPGQGVVYDALGRVDLVQSPSRVVVLVRTPVVRETCRLGRLTLEPFMFRRSSGSSCHGHRRCMRLIRQLIHGRTVTPRD